MPVGIGHNSSIVRTFHPALNFETFNTGFDQLGNMFDHTKIIGVQNKGAVIFCNLKILSGPGLLHEMILPAAGLGTLSAIGVSVSKIIGKQTPTGKGNTHRPVDKSFQPKSRWRMGTDFTDFFQRELPGQHNGISSLIIQVVGRAAVYYSELSADVPFDMGRITGSKRKHTEICDDQPVYPC